VLINDGTNIGVSGNINLSGATPTYKVTNLIAPTAAADAATKGYVDAATSQAGGGSILLIGTASMTPTAPTCPTNWTSAFAGYWNCPGFVSPSSFYGVGGTCFCGLDQSYYFENSSDQGTRYFSHQYASTNYYYVMCRLCVK